MSVPDSLEHFSACTIDLSLDDSRVNEPGRQRVKVSCDRFRRWSLYVNGEIQLRAPVLTVAGAGGAGDRVSAGDVSLQMRDLSELRRGYLTDVDFLAGKTLRRRVGPGDVLTPDSFERAEIVSRGQRVAIRSAAHGLTVSAPGSAMEDGAAGDSIRVKNLSSGKTVYGTITGPGVVSPAGI